MQLFVLSVLCWCLVFITGLVIGTWYPDDLWCDLVLVFVVFLIRSVSKRFELIYLYTLRNSIDVSVENWPLIKYTVESLRRYDCLDSIISKVERWWNITPGEFSQHIGNDQSLCRLAIIAASTCATLITFMTRSNYIFWIVRSFCGFEWCVAAFLLTHEPLLCMSAIKDPDDFGSIKKLWNPLCWCSCNSKFICKGLVFYLLSLSASTIMSFLMLWGYVNIAEFAETYNLRIEYLAIFVGLSVIQFAIYSGQKSNSSINAYQCTDNSKLFKHAGCVSLMRNFVHVLMFTTTTIFFKSYGNKIVLTIVSICSGVIDTWLVNRIGYIFYIIDDKIFSYYLYQFVALMIQTNVIADVLAQFIFFDHYINILIYDVSLTSTFTTLWAIIFCSVLFGTWFTFKA